MSDTGIVDTFLDTFTSYIDSGFGLLGGEVGFLSSTLIAIDVTIAGLFWAWGADEDVIQRLVKKTLYIGAFAFIIGNFQTLSTILFDSFAGLGLKASGDAISLAEFMKPGSIAATGLDAAQPLIDATEAFNSLWAVFANPAIIVVLLLAAGAGIAYAASHLQLYMISIPPLVLCWLATCYFSPAGRA